MNDRFFCVKIWISVSILVVSVLLFAVTFSVAIDEGQEDDLNIYFCAEDIFQSSSSGSKNVAETTAGDVENKTYIAVQNSLEGDRLRHCFFLMGFENRTKMADNNTLLVRPINTIGFGSAKNRLSWETTTYPENLEDLSRSNISCKFMFGRKNLNPLYVEKADGDCDLGMGFLWANTTTLLQRKAKNHSYSLCSYNCCSAAKEVCNELGAGQVCEDVDKVNFGIGTKFTGILKASKAIFSPGQDL